MLGSQSRQLTTRQGVADQNRRFNLERADNVKDIICAPLIVVARLGMTGVAESAARDREKMAAVCKFAGEIVVDMCCVA